MQNQLVPILLVLLVVAIGVAAWLYLQKKKTEQLRGSFGPEYERAVHETGDRRKAEAELEARKDDPDATADLGVAYAALQCSDLLARGAPGIHFYTLNRSPATRAILAALRAAHPWDRALEPV